MSPSNNPHSRYPRFILWLAVAAIFCLADQYAKQTAGETAGQIVCNDGTALGLGAPNTLILTLGILFLAILSRWLFLATQEAFWLPFGITLFLAGGVGNLLDRLRFGCVRDAWTLPFTPLTNNLADYLIFAGACVLILRYAFSATKEGAARE